MQPNQAEIVRREQMASELERTLRAIDTLPAEERMVQLRKLAAGPLPKTKLAVVPPIPAPETAKQRDQKRLLQLRRLCQRFWLTRHTSTMLCSFVGARLSERSKPLLRISHSAGRLSPLQEVVWNVAPFFRHTRRTYTTRTGHISWEDVVQFLSLVQESQRGALEGRAPIKIVNQTCRLRNEANRLRVIYQRIHDEAPNTPYAAQVGHLLARHTGHASS